ncbi:hypothetical protein ACI65C_003975 [Semiaphis heraclei]
MSRGDRRLYYDKSSVSRQSPAIIIYYHMLKMSFSPENDELLIEEVRQNTVLYNSQDIKHKDEIWKNIAGKVGKSMDDCKKRWKNIRDTHNRYRKRLGTGSASSAKKNWSLAGRVSFLNNVECERNSSSNLSTQQSDLEAADCSIEADIDVGVNEFSDEESAVSPGCSYAGKRVRSKTDKLNVLLAKRAKDRNTIIETIEKQNEKILNLHKTEEDDVDFFFKSLAITVKKLPNKGINEVKIKSLALVTEIQEKYSAPEQPRITSVVPDQTNYYQLSSLQAVSDSAVLYPMSSNYSGFGNCHNNHGEQ